MTHPRSNSRAVAEPRVKPRVPGPEPRSLSWQPIFPGKQQEAWQEPASPASCCATDACSPRQEGCAALAALLAAQAGTQSWALGLSLCPGPQGSLAACTELPAACTSAQASGRAAVPLQPPRALATTTTGAISTSEV